MSENDYLKPNRAKEIAAPNDMAGHTEFALLCAKWHDKAITLREEAGRMHRTVKCATGAEERCNVRAEIYDRCASELEGIPWPATKDV